MGAQIQERVALPSFTDPVLITAFSTAHKGGMTANWAVGNLMTQWNATLVAEFEAEECYNFGRMRPTFRRRGNNLEIDWPANMVYAATPPGSDRTFLFLVGIEPTLNWRSFAEAVTQFAMRAGVQTAISMRAIPGSVTHRQAGSVLAFYSRSDLQDAFCAPVLPMVEGLADIGIVINRCLQTAGCDVIDLFVAEPFYTPALPYAKAGGALLETMCRAYGVTFDRDNLLPIIEQQDQAFDTLVAASDELRSSVEIIEREGASLLANGGSPWYASNNGAQAQEEPLNPREVLQDVESLFRELGQTE